jgi:hypothetical protein
MNHPVVCCRVRPLPTTSSSVSPSPSLTTTSLSSFSSSSASSSFVSVGSSKEDVTKPCVVVDKLVSFEMDHVFDVDSTQEQIFTQIMPNVLQDLLKGINCTLFTYGQTGSGKTYTMQGQSQAVADNTNNNSVAVAGSRGLIPRIVESIFQLCAERTGSVSDPNNSKPTPLQKQINAVATKNMNRCEIYMSMLEIYQEKLFDLLNNDTSTNSTTNSSSQQQQQQQLRIRENTADGSIFVQGLTEQTISNDYEFQAYYSQALKKRVTGSHNMNTESSRSHLVCILFIKQQLVGTTDTSKSATTQTNTNKSQQQSPQQQQTVTKICSKIHLIDLAGSELVRKTGADGTRLQEAKYINKSLSALGNVINALTNNATVNNNSSNNNSSNSNNNSGGGVDGQAVGGEKHVPYRCV